MKSLTLSKSDKLLFNKSSMDIFMSNLYVKGSFVASALDIVDLDGISPAAFRDFTSLVPQFHQMLLFGSLMIHLTMCFQLKYQKMMYPMKRLKTFLLQTK